MGMAVEALSPDDASSFAMWRQRQEENLAKNGIKVEVVVLPEDADAIRELAHELNTTGWISPGALRATLKAAKAQTDASRLQSGENPLSSQYQKED